MKMHGTVSPQYSFIINPYTVYCVYITFPKKKFNYNYYIMLKEKNCAFCNIKVMSFTHYILENILNLCLKLSIKIIR